MPSIPEIDTKQPDHVGYNPGVSGLNLNYNRVHFEWKRVSGGYSVAMDARTERYRPEVAVSRMRVVDRAAPVYTYDEKGGVDTWTVARAALGDGGARWLPVRHPELYAAALMDLASRSATRYCWRVSARVGSRAKTAWLTSRRLSPRRPYWCLPGRRLKTWMCQAAGSAGGATDASSG